MSGRGELDGPVPGRLVGRERHVLGDDAVGGPPPWLDGLPAQRAYVARLAATMVEPDARLLRHSAPMGLQAVAAGVQGLRGGTAGAAASLRRSLSTRGPTFLKVGQLISGGVGLFPDEFVEAFADFQDRLAPEPWSHVERVLHEDLPGGLTAFADIDETPVAAASIAQVHRATLADGQAVVVKVQRPLVANRIRTELRWLATVADLVDRAIPPARGGNLPGIIEYLADTIVEELDFRLEAENMLDVAEAVARSERPDGVAVPRPHPRLVTRRVLVMERFDGFSSSDVAGIGGAGIDTEKMLSSGFLAFLEGAMIHGVFHGDLHPGNVIVLPDGRYGIVDYGIVGRLTVPERAAFARMLGTGAAGDTRGQLAAMRDLGGFPEDVDLDALAEGLPSALLGGGAGLPSMGAVAESMQVNLAVMRRHRFRLPRLLVLLSKNLIFADDAIARFAPGLDLLTPALPVVARAAGLLRSSGRGVEDAELGSLQQGR